MIIEALLAICRQELSRLERAPLLERFGKRLAGELRIPLQVWPYAPRQDPVTAQPVGGLPRMPETEEELEKQRYRPRHGASEHRNRMGGGWLPDALETAAQEVRFGMLVGDPGSGKTEQLKAWVAREWRSVQTGLVAQQPDSTELPLPLFLSVAALAKGLGLGTERQDQVNADNLAWVRSEAQAILTPDVTQTERSAAALLRAALGEHPQRRLLAPLYWRQWFDQEACDGERPLISLDAWDEVRGNPEMKARLAAAVAALANLRARIWMSSRVAGYDRQLWPVDGQGWGMWQEFSVAPFDWAQTERFVRNWFGVGGAGASSGPPAQRVRHLLDQLRTNVAMGALATHPRLCALLCGAVEGRIGQSPLPLPARRVEVYERMLEELLTPTPGLVPEEEAEGPPAEVEGEVEEGRQAKLELLRSVAGRMWEKGLLEAGFSRADLVLAIQDFLRQREGLGTQNRTSASRQAERRGEITDGEALASEWVERDGVLIEIPGGAGFAFLHLTLAEYLVAGSWATEANGRGWSAVEHRIHCQSWVLENREIIIQYAGLLKRAGLLRKFFALLSIPASRADDPRRNDLLYSRLCLAVESLPEAPEGLRQRLREQVTDLVNSLVALVRHGFRWDERWEKTTIEGGFPCDPLDVRAFVSAAPVWQRALRALAYTNVRVDTVLGLRPFWEMSRLVDWFAAGGHSIQFDAHQAVRSVGLSSATSEILDRLVPLLADCDQGVRKRATELFRAFGKEGMTPAILAKLAPLLTHEDEEVGRNALNAALCMGSAAATPEILAGMAALVSRDGRNGSQHVMYASRCFGLAAATPEILTLLAGFLADDREQVLAHALEAVDNFGPAAATAEMLAGLKEMLADRRSAIRARVLGVIGKLGPAASTPEIVGRVAEVLEEDEATIRHSVAYAVRRLGPGAVTPRMALRMTEFVADKEESVGRAAFEALGNLGSTGANPEVLDRLVELLTDEDPVVRRRVASAMGRSSGIPSVAKRDFQAWFAERLAAGKIRATSEVIDAAFSQINPADATAQMVRTLEELSAVSDAAIVLAAVDALQKLRKLTVTPQLLTRLAGWLRDGDPGFRHRLVRTISELGRAAATSEITTGLIDCLAVGELGTGWLVADVLGKMGKEALPPEVLERLKALLSSGRGWAQVSAALALVHLDRESATREGERLRAEGLSEDDPVIQSLAGHGIRGLGLTATAIPRTPDALAKAMLGQDHELAIAAIGAVGKMGAAAATPEVLKSLLTVLARGRPEMRLAVVSAIGSIGNPAATPEVLEELISCLTAGQIGLHHGALDALRKLDVRTATAAILDRWRGLPPNLLMDAIWDLCGAEPVCVTPVLARLKNEVESAGPWGFSYVSRVLQRVAMRRHRVLFSPDGKLLVWPEARLASDRSYETKQEPPGVDEADPGLKL